MFTHTTLVLLLMTGIPSTYGEEKPVRKAYDPTPEYPMATNDQDVVTAMFVVNQRLLIQKAPKTAGAFLFQDLERVHNAEVITTKDDLQTVLLLLLNSKSEIVHQISLPITFTRKKYAQIITQLGFFVKRMRRDKVPEEYKTGPYVPIFIKDEL